MKNWIERIIIFFIIPLSIVGTFNVENELGRTISIGGLCGSATYLLGRISYAIFILFIIDRKAKTLIEMVQSLDLKVSRFAQDQLHQKAKEALDKE